MIFYFIFIYYHFYYYTYYYFKYVWLYFQKFNRYRTVTLYIFFKLHFGVRVPDIWNMLKKNIFQPAMTPKKKSQK